MYTIDVDVGGTLTDGLFSDGRTVTAVKVDTTPHDLTVCLMDCLQEGATRLGYEELESFLGDVRLIRWSTTITSNVLAEHAGPKVGLFVSAGNEQSLYAGHGNGHSAALGTLVDLSNVVGVDDPVDAQMVMRAVKGLLENGVRRVCVSLKGAFEDPTAERAIIRAIETQYPDHFLGAVPVLLGSDVSHYPDDMTRTHHALINAYVHGSLATALYKAEDDLRAAGYDRPLLIGHANGGVARVSKTKALDTLESGPTLGLFGAAYFAQRYGLEKVVTLDVGGTTAKVGLIEGGRPLMTDYLSVLGIPVHAPVVMLQSIALGGGSVVSTQDGRIELGPKSMGAYPGPASYDLGGDKATLTDALVTLGWLNPDYFMGGVRTLNSERAAAALEKEIAQPLGKSLDEAAGLVVEQAFRTVAESITKVLDEEGWDAADCTLFAYGGNGPIFASGVAERADIAEAYVFDLGPVLSAFGSSVSDITHVYEYGVGKDTDVAAVVRRMHNQAMRDMKGEGIDTNEVAVTLELETTDAEGKRSSVSPALDEALNRELPGNVSLARLRATYPMPHYEPAAQNASGGEPTVKGQREINWAHRDAGGRQMAGLYTWEEVQPGQTVTNGAILESRTTTYPVPPGWTLVRDRYGNGHLRKK